MRKSFFGELFLQNEEKYSKSLWFQNIAVYLQKKGCTRQFESKFSLRLFALSLQLDI